MDLVTFTMLCAVQGSTILTPCATANSHPGLPFQNSALTASQPVTTTRLPHTLAAAKIASWQSLIGAAAQRFAIPETWIRAVMKAESAGQTTLNGRPITSSAGAMGLMQLMPGTYQDMRTQYGLGVDPYDPHDNIFAGAAYLRAMYQRYGYPYAFAAYQAGPKRLDDYLLRGNGLPMTTRAYLDCLIPGDGIALSRGGQNTGNPPFKSASHGEIDGMKARPDALLFVRNDHAHAPDSLVQTRTATPNPPISTTQPPPFETGLLFVPLLRRTP